MKCFSWVERWISYWMDMICGLIGILTLGIYRPWWDFKIRYYIAKKKLKNKIDKQP